MKYFKLKKLILEIMIHITLTYSSFKLAQSFTNILNLKQIEEYQKVIKDFTNLLKEEEIEDPVKIFDYYNYALWNGYLSDNHSYHYDTNHDFYISNFGLSCINGEGVCLNKADFLTSIFKEYGYDAHTLFCYFDEELITINQIRTNQLLDRKVVENSNVFLEKLINFAIPLAKLTGNHAITYVEYEGNFYFFDPTNLVYLEKKDLNTVEVINGKGSFDLKYFTSSFFEDFNSIEVLNNIGYCKEDILNTEEVEINIESLEQFYNNEEKSYQLISEQLSNKYQFWITVLCLYYAQLIVRLIYHQAIFIGDKIKISLSNKKEEELQKTKIKKEDFKI